MGLVREMKWETTRRREIGKEGGLREGKRGREKDKGGYMHDPICVYCVKEQPFSNETFYPQCKDWHMPPVKSFCSCLFFVLMAFVYFSVYSVHLHLHVVCHVLCEFHYVVTVL